ncbi:Uma2 family endonuclease [Streptomyces triticisoli]|jgi:Uma2 family endonuclease|uniref:Uma2 family endonuclease n=1 Tax=Streptomyces triticisoli TaxID=2182797 RepID=UPI000DD831D6|nr:Uma2 family endonuclease [Streptomyces triticisoli]
MDTADADKRVLDELFDQMTVPEGYKAEIVEGAVFMVPQTHVHWQIIWDIVEQVSARHPHKGLLSDVRVDYPGPLNGFASDVTLLTDKTTREPLHHQDVEFVAEVISKGTAHNDYGPKKTAYAHAAVPVYLIADPFQGKCRLYTRPEGREYLSELSVRFGTDVDMTTTPLGLTLKTDEFSRG